MYGWVYNEKVYLFEYAPHPPPSSQYLIIFFPILPFPKFKISAILCYLIDPPPLPYIAPN